jgi:hypothetical protein
LATWGPAISTLVENTDKCIRQWTGHVERLNVNRLSESYITVLRKEDMSGDLKEYDGKSREASKRSRTLKL